MMMLAIESLLFGAILSQRFKVLGLLPALLAGIGVIACICWFSATPLTQTAKFVISFSVALQLGYLGGLLGGFAIGVAKANKLRADRPIGAEA